MPQIHGGHAAGTVLGQCFGGHAGHAGAQRYKLACGQVGRLQAAHRHNMPRRFEGDAQLGTLPVKHGAIREQPAVQLQKQPVPEGVEADRGRGWHPQLFFFFGSVAGVLQRCGQAVGVRSILTR